MCHQHHPFRHIPIFPVFSCSLSTPDFIIFLYQLFCPRNTLKRILFSAFSEFFLGDSHRCSLALGGKFSLTHFRMLLHNLAGKSIEWYLLSVCLRNAILLLHILAAHRVPLLSAWMRRTKKNLVYVYIDCARRWGVLRVIELSGGDVRLGKMLRHWKVVWI